MKLTPIEQQTIELTCQGYSQKEIANMQQRSRVAIAATLERVRKKNDIKNQKELITSYNRYINNNNQA